jgi:hypothetical protein
MTTTHGAERRLHFAEIAGDVEIEVALRTIRRARRGEHIVWLSSMLLQCLMFRLPAPTVRARVHGKKRVFTLYADRFQRRFQHDGIVDRRPAVQHGLRSGSLR